MIHSHDIAEQVLSRCAGAAGCTADVFIRSSSSTTVEVNKQEVDAFERANESGAGLRVLCDGRMGFSYTTDFSKDGIDRLVASAMAGARHTMADPSQVIPGQPTQPFRDVVLYDPAVTAVSDRDRIEAVLAMERAAFAVDGRVKRIRKAQATYSESRTIIMNSRGAAVEFAGTAVSASIEVVAEEGAEAQAGWEYDAARFLRNVDLTGVGSRAARKAVGLLGAKHLDSVRAPVVLEPTVAMEFLEILAGGLSAESVQKKRSLLVGKLDQQVVSQLITVRDDGLLEGGIGSAPSDDELVPTRNKTVIDRGRLAMYLYNARTAAKDGTESTGNGIRGGFKGTPGVGITNLYIQKGDVTPDRLLADTARGLLVTEIMGAHTANPISGDFSVGASGFWIENGRAAFPVREVTIAGNILDLMRDVDAVADDLRFSGRLGSPTLRIRELSIAGK